MALSHTTGQTFPVEYLNAIDEVLMGATYAGRYNVGAAEFVNSRQVMVPDVSFGSSPEPKDYDRFSTESGVTLNRTAYSLDHDVEKVFYLDAVDVIDEAAVSMTKVVSEWERTVFAPYIDKDFFSVAAAKAKTTATDELTASNIKSVIRAARTQFHNAGLSGAELYMTSNALALLEDATDRQWSNETSIVDTVGVYDGFTIFEVPAETLGCDLLAISGGTQTVRYITKRAATYAFAPGQHAKGDGWLTQMRWVFGTIVRKNRVPGIFASKYTAPSAPNVG